MDRRTARHRKRVWTRILCIIGAILGVLTVVALLLGVTAYFFRERGRVTFEQHAAEGQAANSNAMAEVITEETSPGIQLEEGQILYHGTVYEYNEDLLTILCLGIDNRKGIAEEKKPGAGGQSDYVVLAVLDRSAGSFTLVTVSRDAMVPVKIYDEYGMYVGEETKQLALQYAYGNGRESSCELMEQAVSKLFYGIPIHGYCALSLNVIAELNDAVGGVTVTVPEELAEFCPEFKAGETVTLKGQQAYKFVQRRNTKAKELGANNLRMNRQKQYVLAFVKQLKEAVKQDISIPVKLYTTAEKQMVTSISLEQAVYLCTEFQDVSFTADDIYSVTGEVTQGEIYEEFQVDDEALYELILKVFYKEVPNP